MVRLAGLWWLATVCIRYKSPMRLMAVLERIASSGTEWQAVHVLCELARRSIEVDVVSLQSPPAATDVSELTRALTHAGITQFELGLSHRWNLAEGAWRLSQLARERNTDIIHGRLYFAGVHVAATSRLLPRTPRVVSFHNVIYDYPNQKILDHCRKHIESGLLRMGVHAFAAVSTSAAESYKRNLHISTIEVIPNAVPVTTLVPSPSDRIQLAQKYGLRPKVPWVLVPARLVFEKGHIYLIHAAKILLSRGIDFQFIFAGYGPMLDTLVQQVRRAHVHDNVRLLGYDVPRSELMNLMDASDIIVLGSLFEGFPNTAAEAMAKAKPFIGTTIGGFRDLIDPERNGILVPPRDAGALAQAVERLLADKGLQQTLGLAGRRTVEEHFSVAPIARRWERFYQKTLERI